MEVKLFLRNINQEHIGTKGLSAEGWDGNVWQVDCCVIAPAGISDPQGERVYPARKGLVLRKETDGGIFWDPNSGAVYRVDEEAYHAILELDRGVSEPEVARRLGVDLKSVRKLVRRMQRITSGKQLS
jgi:hypothetical protein